MSIFIATSLVFVGFVTAFIYYLKAWDYDYWKRRGVKGPKPMAFFGNIKDGVLRKKSYNEIFEENYNLFPNEKVVGMYRTKTPALLVRDIETVKHVMIKDFNNFVDRGVDFDKEGLGVNLFHSDAETWRVLRSRFSPIFTSGKLKNMMYLMNKSSEKFMNYLKPEHQKNPVANIHELISKYTIINIASCAFGLDMDINDLINRNHVLHQINDKIFNLNYFSELDMMFPGILAKLSSSVFPKMVSEFFYNLVERIMSERNGVSSGRKDFMDLLLDLKNDGKVQGSRRYEDDQIKVVDVTESLMAAQAFVFYAAGFETTASTMTFMLHQLAYNQDVQEKLFEEIDKLHKSVNGDFTFDQLNEFTYIGQVFDETLRLFPIVDPVSRRLTSKSYQIPDTDITIDKGTLVFVSVKGIHSDPKYWPNPEKFDPERFSPENIKNIPSCAYMPFGIGPRNCIGMRFAHVQSRMLLVKLLHKYRMEPCAETNRQLTYDATKAVLTAKGGIKLKLVARS